MGALEPTSVKVAKFILISGRYFLPAEFLGIVYFTDQTGSVFIIASFCVYKKYYIIYKNVFKIMPLDFMFGAIHKRLLTWQKTL